MIDWTKILSHDHYNHNPGIRGTERFRKDAFKSCKNSLSDWFKASIFEH